MKHVFALVAIGFLLCLPLSTAALPEGRSVKLTVVYSNNIIGQIEPCPT